MQNVVSLQYGYDKSYNGWKLWALRVSYDSSFQVSHCECCKSHIICFDITKFKLNKKLIKSKNNK